MKTINCIKIYGIALIFALIQMNVSAQNWLTNSSNWLTIAQNTGFQNPNNLIDNNTSTSDVASAGTNKSNISGCNAPVIDSPNNKSIIFSCNNPSIVFDKIQINLSYSFWQNVNCNQNTCWRNATIKLSYSNTNNINGTYTILINKTYSNTNINEVLIANTNTNAKYWKLELSAYTEAGCTGTTTSTTVNLKINEINWSQNKAINPNISQGLIIGNCITLNASSASKYIWSTGETAQNITVCNSNNYTITTTNNGVDAIGSTGAYISSFNQNLFTPNGEVYSIYKNGNNVYLGGDFNYLGPVCGNTALVNNSTGKFDNTMPRIIGKVDIIIPDEKGGWFVAGDFTKIGAFSCKYLSHINPDKTVDTAFTNHAIPNAKVTSLYLKGAYLYVGGNFTKIGGISRNYIAQLDRFTGMGTSWDASANGIVNSLIVYNDKVYAGGNFTNIGGQSRNYLATIDTVYAQASTWNPAPSAAISKLYLYGIKLYVVGDFTTIGGQSRNRIASYTLSTGNIDTWNPNSNGKVYDIFVSGSTIYLAGVFTNIGGQTRNRIAAVNNTSGVATSWNPNANDTVFALASSGGNIITGGKFTNICGQGQNNIAAIDISTGNSVNWNPNINALKGKVSCIYALSTYNNDIYIGGSFYSMGGSPRNNIAAIDGTTGQLLSWDANANGIVRTIYADNNYVYIGGDFTQLGGWVTKNRIAQLKVSDAMPTGWNPNSDNTVNAIVFKGSYLYIGGAFANIGGNARTKFAQIKISDGTSTTWNPAPNGIVRALAVGGDSLYIGGEFTTIGGQTRNRIASYTISNTTITSFDPNANNTVYALACVNGKVFAGGAFTTISGQTKGNIVSFNATVDAVTNTSGISYALAVTSKALYMGGKYDINNYPFASTSNATAFDINSGLSYNYGYWNPSPNDIVRSIFIDKDKIYLGGKFTEVVSTYQPFFTWVDNFCTINTQLDKPFSTSFCEGDNVPIKKNKEYGYTYHWYKDDVLIADATDTAYIPVRSGKYNILITDTIQGGSLFTNVVSVSVDPLADTVINANGQTYFCGTGSVDLSAVTGTGYSYQWNKNNNPISGANASKYTATATGVYYCDVYNSSGCPKSSQKINVSTTGLTPTVTSDGSLTFCEGDTVTLSSNYASGNQWYKNNVATGQTTQNISVTQSGDYKLFVNDNGCSGYSVVKTVTVKSKPAAPIVTSPVTYCQNVTATSVAATGINLLWYTAAIGGIGGSSAPTPSTASASTISNYVSQTVNGCESQRAQIDVNVNATPIAPIVISPVTYCQNVTATVLTATGSNLLWYTNETGGTGSSTAPTPSTANADMTSNYVSQTINSCEGPRAKIDVVVNLTPATPTVTSTVSYCQNVTSTTLTAIGGNLLWYTAATGGTGNSSAPTPSTTVIGITGNYVSQTINSCESPRAQINVLVNSIPSAPTVTSPVTYCQYNAATVLTATGSNLLWYTAVTGGTGSYSAPTPSTAIASTISNYVSQTINGCESPRSQIDIIINSKPNTPVIILKGDTLFSNDTIGNQWYNQNGLIKDAISQDYIVDANGDYYSIITINGCISDKSNIVNVILTGINSLNNIISFKIYPNPVNDELIIEADSNTIKTNFEIVNAIGQIVFKGNLLKKTVIKTENFYPGVYIIRLDTGKTFEFKKVVKN